MTTKVEHNAHMAGFYDAINGRVYRPSADLGTRNRQHLDHYEGGWYLGRRELDESRDESLTLQDYARANPAQVARDYCRWET